MRNQSQMKEIIADAFVALAHQKNIDKITVKDLVDYCDISRQSFYYHFQDILEVIEWQTQRVEQDISARCREAGTFEDAIKILSYHVTENQRLFEKLRDSQKRDFIEQLVMDSLQAHFREAAREAAVTRPLDMSGAEAEAIISFFSFGLAGLIITHCKSKSPDADMLTRQIISVFKRLIPEIDTMH